MNMRYIVLVVAAAFLFLAVVAIFKKWMGDE